MKTILLYFSDIHLTGKTPENKGVVMVQIRAKVIK